MVALSSPGLLAGPQQGSTSLDHITVRMTYLLGWNHLLDCVIQAQVSRPIQEARKVEQVQGNVEERIMHQGPVWG